MDFIQLGADRLKIMLSSADMDEYSINCDTMDYGDTGTRRAFWSILDEAKRETGFNAASGRAYIQVYRGREGGCELFVTMLADGLGAAPSDVFSLCCEESVPPESVEIFYFENVENMLSTCAVLERTGYVGRSRGYAVHSGGYCIAFYPEGDFFADFLCEYGRRLDSFAAESFLSEHCSVICDENAVETLAVLC